MPHKATAIVQIMNGIESLADFNQRLGRRMASQPALEPIHAVLCDMLRSGTDFATNTRRNPLGIATQAVRQVCSTPDDDATVFKARTSRKTTQSPTSTAAGSKRFTYERSTGPNATIFHVGIQIQTYLLTIWCSRPWLHRLSRTTRGS